MLIPFYLLATDELLMRNGCTDVVAADYFQHYYQKCTNLFNRCCRLSSSASIALFHLLYHKYLNCFKKLFCTQTHCASNATG